MTWPAGVAQWFAAPEEHLVEDEPRLVDCELDCRFVELARRPVEADVHPERVVGRPRQPAAVVLMRPDRSEHVVLADLSLEKCQTPCLKLSEGGHGSILRVSLAEDEKVRADLVRD